MGASSLLHCATRLLPPCLQTNSVNCSGFSQFPCFHFNTSSSYKLDNKTPTIHTSNSLLLSYFNNQQTKTHEFTYQFFLNPKYINQNPNYMRWRIKPLTSKAWMVLDDPTNPILKLFSCSSSSSSSKTLTFLLSFYIWCFWCYVGKKDEESVFIRWWSY